VRRLLTRAQPRMPAPPHQTRRVPPRTEPGTIETLYYLNEAPGTPPFLAPRPSSLVPVCLEVRR